MKLRQEASKKINLVFRDHIYQKRGFKDELINHQEFMVELFDNVEQAKRAGEIGAAIPEACLLPMTDIAVEMEGESAAGYIDLCAAKRTHRQSRWVWRTKAMSKSASCLAAWIESVTA